MRRSENFNMAVTTSGLDGDGKGGIKHAIGKDPHLVIELPGEAGWPFRMVRVDNEYTQNHKIP